MSDYHDFDIAGVRRRLPWRRIDATTEIAFLQLIGDVELVRAVASAMYEKAARVPDLVVVPEVKAIPLAHELAALWQRSYIVVRKSVRSYAKSPLTASAASFTNREAQVFYLDDDEVSRIRGRTVIVVDDVATTGATVAALTQLVTTAGGAVCQIMVAALEGDAHLPDVTAIARLPAPRRLAGE